MKQHLINNPGWQKGEKEKKRKEKQANQNY